MKAELQNRLLQFSRDLILTAQGITLSTINRRTVANCIESGTNAGAEYAQAGSATTSKSFAFKINMCKSELATAVYRLDLLVNTDKTKRADREKLLTEAKELSTIFSKISRKLKKNAAEKVEEKEESKEE